MLRRSLALAGSIPGIVVAPVVPMPFGFGGDLAEQIGRRSGAPNPHGFGRAKARPSSVPA